MKLWLAFLLVSSLLVPARALAQAPSPPPQRDVLSELLAEVHGLREAMERAATIGARIQLLVARVQLQEQRIAELSRRLVAIRTELPSLDSQAAGVTASLAMFEKSANNSKMPGEEREQFEQMLQGFKSQAAGFDKRRQDLLDEESHVVQQISADQARWNDVNAQLDDIERTLATPPKK
jgi:uncharacterized coiled-coil protein SlyX